MPENNPTPQPQPQTAAPAPQGLRPCPKDCSKCSFQQHAFCAAKMSFDSFTVMNAMMQRMDAMTNVIADMSAKIAAIQSAEAELAAPAPVQAELFKD